MKKKIIIPILIAVAGIFALIISCEEDPQESCEDAEICDNKTVISCCTSNSDGDITCVYKYNGKEYQESEIDDLAKDLGCSSATSLNHKEEINGVIVSLKALMENARSTINQE